MQQDNPQHYIVSGDHKFTAGTIFECWMPDFKTAKSWKYENNRLLGRNAKACFVEFEEGVKIPVFHLSQAHKRKRIQTPFQVAQQEFLRRFWLHSSTEKYLWCGTKTTTMDNSNRKKAGKSSVFLSERMVIEHLEGKSVYGVFAEAPEYRESTTYWVAIDLDLHLKTGGNLDIFKKQLGILLKKHWGRAGSQLAVSPELVNGVHLYFYFPRPQRLDRVVAGIRSILKKLHSENPELAAEVDAWNEKLKGTRWKVRQLADLEIYPDKKHGFRFVGTRGKVVLADKILGPVSWGTYRQGKNKGKAKVGFDVLGWWESLQKPARMAVADVISYVESRLPQVDDPSHDHEPENQRSLSNREEKKRDLPIKVPSSQNSSKNGPSEKGLGSMFRQTRRKLTGFWSGAFNPEGSFEKAVVITGRLLAKEGLSKEETIQLIQTFARELPEEARHCSTRLMEEDWGRIDLDIAKSVKGIFDGNGRQNNIEQSNQELDKTTETWRRSGFRLSDKSTWGTSPSLSYDVIQLPDPLWTESDIEDFKNTLMPALKIKDVAMTIEVATEIVKLTAWKERAEDGWGYDFLAKWLPDKFEIPCAKKSKQAGIFQALRDLQIIDCRVKHQRPVKNRPGRATSWRFGTRAAARVAGDRTDAWQEVRDQDWPELPEEVTRLLATVEW